jgi:hypothetical protein
MERDNYSTAGQALGIASLILAILALIFSFIPCFGYFAIAPAALAILFGALGLVQASKANAPRGLILSGLIIGIIAFLIAGAWGLLISGGTNSTDYIEEEFVEELNNVVIDNHSDEDIDETVSKFEEVVDSIDVREINIKINDQELSDDEKEKLKESVKDAGKKVGDAFKELAKDIKEIEDEDPE